jgi:ubiquinone biosynthesis protein
VISPRRYGLFERTYRNLKRYRRILTVLLKYGFDGLVTELQIDRYVDVGLKTLRIRKAEGVETLSGPRRLRLALEELGPTFVKFGQILSTRADFLTEDYARELEQLQANVAPVPAKLIVGVIEEELGRPMGEVFEDFNPKPIGSASIGQVHQARLKTGEQVVLKIQRPRIADIIDADLEIMEHLASLVEKHLPDWRIHEPRRLVRDFARTLENEMNYLVEASNMERFATQFRGEEGLRVPITYPELTTRRLLVMEQVTGVRPTGAEVLRGNGFNPATIAHRGFDLMLKQIFLHGFFHADPHPGNLLVQGQDRICYLDFGMMGQLSRREREQFADVVMAIGRRDERAAAEAFLSITHWDDEPDRDELERALSAFMNAYFNRPLKELNIGRLLDEIIALIVSFRMKLDGEYVMVIKALATAEGLGRQLDPEFDPVAKATPFLIARYRERFSVPRMREEMAYTAADLYRLVRDLPNMSRDLLRQIRSGRARFEFELRDLEKLMDTLDIVSNRISMSLLIGALVIGSSVVVHSNIPPRWHEIPLLGIAGYLFAMVLIVVEVIAISRKRRR